MGKCSRTPFACCYSDARQCGHDRATSDDSPKVCDCPCHEYQGCRCMGQGECEFCKTNWDGYGNAPAAKVYKTSRNERSAHAISK